MPHHSTLQTEKSAKSRPPQAAQRFILNQIRALIKNKQYKLIQVCCTQNGGHLFIYRIVQIVSNFLHIFGSQLPTVQLNSPAAALVYKLIEVYDFIFWGVEKRTRVVVCTIRPSRTGSLKCRTSCIYCYFQGCFCMFIKNIYILFFKKT